MGMLTNHTAKISSGELSPSTSLHCAATNEQATPPQGQLHTSQHKRAEFALLVRRFTCCPCTACIHVVHMQRMQSACVPRSPALLQPAMPVPARHFKPPPHIAHFVLGMLHSS